jgi:uncharacterized membrane protein
MIIAGLVIIGCGLYIYFVAHTIYPDSTSSRVQRLNWLLRNLGRVPTSLLFIFIGFIPVFSGIKRLLEKKSGEQ